MFEIFFILFGLVKCNNVLLIDNTPLDATTVHIIPANDLDQYVRYASHVFFPNKTEPVQVGFFLICETIKIRKNLSLLFKEQIQE